MHDARIKTVKHRVKDSSETSRIKTERHLRFYATQREAIPMYESDLPPQSLSHVLHELVQREPIFHRPEFGRTRRDFAAQIVDDYWEVGASGQRYSRDVVLDILERRHSVHVAEDDWRTSEFEVTEIAPDNYLLTYLLQQGERYSRRATLWRHSDAGWQAVYHQGTLVAGER